MRILFCNYEYPPLGGGGGIVNGWLADELAKRHEVTVLTSRIPGQPAEEQSGGVRILRVPVFFRRSLAAANMLSMIAYLPAGMLRGSASARGGAFDIVNTHFVLPTGPVGHVVSQLARIPNVLSVHGGDLYDPSKRSSPHRNALLRSCVRRLIRAADAVVAQSSNTLSNVHRYFAPDAAAQIIPLGIPRPPAVEARRADYGWSGQDVLLVTTGRLVARKAVGQLIQMVAVLAEPRVKLIVIGSGPLKESLQEQAQALGVAAQVRFTGRVDELEKYRLLGMGDVFVTASQHEGFGLVFLEAMAMGKPIVCYDEGGQTDFLVDGETGFVVPLNDADAFARRCRLLIGAPETRLRIGEKNARRVESAYFIDHCAEAYESLFASVLERPAPRQGIHAAP